MTRFKSASRIIVLVLFAAHSLTACTKWVATTTPLPALIAEQPPQKIRLNLADGTNVELSHPTIVGDSVVTGVAPSASRTLALTSITAIAVQRSNTLGTVGLFALAGVLVVAAIFIHDCGGGCGFSN